MTGAKFRIDRIPARTIASATSWAEAEGVVMIPIAALCSLTMSPSSSIDRIVNPSICVPIFAGSMSTRATVRNPRRRNPR